MIPYKVMTNLYVFCSGVLNLVFGKIYNTCVVTQQRYFQPKIFYLLFNPKNLCTIAYSNNVFNSTVERATQACFFVVPRYET